jgi:hypothetical protein
MNDLLAIFEALQQKLDSPSALLLYSATYLGLSSLATYASFCRLVIMSKETTRLDAMVAFWLVGVASLASIFSIAFWGFTPRLMSVLHLAAFVLMFVIARRAWSRGLPDAYVERRRRPRRTFGGFLNG